MNPKPALACLALVALAACNNNDGLRNLDRGLDGPDEFAVIPALPLTMPPSMALPPPTPGGSNITDPDPAADAIVALGGSPEAAFAGGVPAGDAALVTYASRNGTDPAIRSTLAQEDAAIRANAGAGQWLNPLGGDLYYPAYANQKLDAYAELERFQAAGVATPTPPPF
jgi:hypothetical protein